MTHKVTKITLDLPASSYVHAQEQQRQAGHWVSHTLPDILQNVFDKLSSNGNYVFLDKIEINIDSEPWKWSNSQWQKHIFESIKTTNNENFVKNKLLNELHFFLQKGFFTKSQSFDNFKDYEKFFSEKLVEFTDFYQEKWSVYSFETAYFQRFIAGFSNVFLQKFIENIFKLKNENIQLLIKQIKSYALNKPTKLPDLMRYIFTERKRIADHNFEKTIDRINEFKSAKINSIFAKTKESKYKTESQIDQNTIEGIIAPNAGLVLLFPYFKSFFLELGLVENDTFRNNKSQTLAIRALHYLATGRRKSVDNELVMPKILVGMPLETFIHSKTQLPKYIADEADELLDAVREHWIEMAGSNNETIRQSFLQRNGQIYVEPALITIKIENSGIDILLDKIPWGFRHYILPWLPQTIITEWY